jgi:hypothetical protein
MLHLRRACQFFLPRQGGRIFRCAQSVHADFGEQSLGGGTRLDLQFACKTFAAALILPNGCGALALLARISHGSDFLGGVHFLAQLVMEVH